MQVVVPTYNSEAILADTLRSVENLPLLVVDNASKDRTVELVERLAPHAQVITRSTPLSRVQSWQASIEAFVHSTDSTWMKWLFSGDLLYAHQLSALQQAIKAHPEARLVICNYLAVEERSFSWRPPHLRGSTLLYPQDSLEMVTQYGNWFGPPLAYSIHREALLKCKIPEGLTWAADAAFCLEVASKFPVLYLDLEIGEFHVKNRQYFKKCGESPQAIFEESLIRLKACEATQNQEMVSKVQFDAFRRLLLTGDMQIKKQLLAKLKHLLYLWWRR